MEIAEGQALKNSTKIPSIPGTTWGTRSENYWPYIALIFGMLGISMSAIFIKWANAPGPVNGFYRMAIAVTLIAIPFARKAHQQAPFQRRHLLFAALAGLFFAGDIASYGTAVLITSAANATLLGNTAPIWVGLGTMILLRERLRPAFWGGLLVALVGMFAIIGQDFVTHPRLGAADFLGLVSGFCYGMFLLSTERARSGLPSLVSWWISAASSAIALLVLSLLMGLSLTGYSTATYANFVGVAVVTQVAGWITLSYALGHLRASLVAPTLLLQPVITALIAVPLLDQPLSVIQVVGGSLVLCGIFVVHRVRTPTASTSDQPPTFDGA